MIKDLGVSFYEAGLVPAAHVHLAQPQPPQPLDAPVLRPEVAALQVQLHIFSSGAVCGTTNLVGGGVYLKPNTLGRRTPMQPELRTTNYDAIRISNNT